MFWKKNGKLENGEWEEELQKDLQEFELVSGDVSALDEESLDQDIMEMKKSLKWIPHSSWPRLYEMPTS